MSPRPWKITFTGTYFGSSPAFYYQHTQFFWLTLPQNRHGRVGRTARAGRGGLAVTLVGERDVALLQAIEAHVNVKMKEYEAVEEEVVLKSMNKINTARRTGMPDEKILRKN